VVVQKAEDSAAADNEVVEAGCGTLLEMKRRVVVRFDSCAFSSLLCQDSSLSFARPLLPMGLLFDVGHVGILVSCMKKRSGGCAEGRRSNRTSTRAAQWSWVRSRWLWLMFARRMTMSLSINIMVLPAIPIPIPISSPSRTSSGRRWRALVW
jgi:hypothetical protein